MVFLYVQLDFTINILHIFACKCLTGEALSGNILEQLRRATKQSFENRIAAFNYEACVSALCILQDKIPK